MYAEDERLGRLMRAAQEGDGDSYLLLLLAITPRVRQMILRRRRAGPSGDVADLVQDVLLSVHAARATYDSTRPFIPWLLAIVRHRIADGGRRSSRRAACELQVENLDAVLAPVASSAPWSEDVPALREAIRALPPRQRDAIELLKLRELSLKEAAAATGMSIGALKVATHRAMGALRRALAGGDAPGLTA